MKKILATTATAFLMGTTALFAGAVDDVIQQMKDEGFSRIEIKRGMMRTKIEATGADGIEREVMIRNSSDEIVKDERSGADGDGDGHDGGDDDHGDDDEDDHDGGDDDHDGGDDDHDGGDDDHDGGDDDHHGGDDDHHGGGDDHDDDD